MEKLTRFFRSKKPPLREQPPKDSHDLDDPEAIEEELLANLSEKLSIQHGLQEFTLSVTPKTPNSHEVVLSISFSKPTGELTYDVRPGQTSSYLETVVNQDSFETQQERSLGHPIAFAVSQAITQFTEDNSIQVQDFKGPYFDVDRSQEEELQGGYQRKYPINKWYLRFIITR